MREEPASAFAASAGAPFWASIVDTTMDAIITIDATQSILVFNRAASTMFGWPAATILGQPLDRLIPGIQRDAHRRHVDAYAAHAATARAMGATLSLKGLRADGEEFPIEASISRVNEGAAVLMTVIARDVTQLRRAQAAERFHADAQAAHHAKAEFLSRMSHELNTPLNAVLGMARVLQASAGTRLNDAERGQLEQVLAGGERLQALVGHMLGVAAQEAAATWPARTDENAPPEGLVLYIEDNEVNAELVVQVLKCWPRVRVVVAPDGMRGIHLARTLQPDLLLLDMHLPDLHGLRVLEMLRSSATTRHLCVAALSAAVTPADMATALAAGATRYWTKPIDFIPFRAGVRELLGQARHRPAAAEADRSR